MNNYIVTADLSFNATVQAVENIDGNRFAVGGEFTKVTDSTGEVKDCSYCGIFNKEGILDVSFNFNSPVYALANLGNDKLAVGGGFTQLTKNNGDVVDTSRCVIVNSQTGAFDVSFNFNQRVLAFACLSDVSLAAGGSFEAITDNTGIKYDTSNCVIVNSQTGAFDVSFNFSDTVYALANLENNRLAVGGDFKKLTNN